MAIEVTGIVPAASRARAIRMAVLVRRTPVQWIAAAALLCCIDVARPADWLQFGHDSEHSGTNPDEVILSRDTVAGLTPWYTSVTTNTNIDAAPVYLSAAPTVAGVVNLLFDVSEGGVVVALNADTGSLIWSRESGDELACIEMLSYGSPALDAGRNYVYAYGCDGLVHKYAVFDGTETVTSGWPQVSTLKPYDEHGSSSLAISPDGRYLYSVTNSFGDGGDYQGHLTTIDLQTGAQVVFNAMCSDLPIHFVAGGTPGVDDCADRMSGIWGRPGVTSDPATARIYVTTGNGLFDANTGGFDWGDSVLEFNANGTGASLGMPVDSYTPSEYSYLDGGDLDLGSVSLAILPPLSGSAIQHVGLQTGKDGVLRLIDLGNMNGTSVAGGVGGEISTMPIPTGAFYTNAQPAVWVDDAGDGATWVFVEALTGFSALKVMLDASSRPFLQPIWFSTITQQFQGEASPVVANGVLYILPGTYKSTGYVYALDPHDGTILWQSPSVSTMHWETPIVVEGSVFVSGPGLQRFALGQPPIVHHVLAVVRGDGGAIAPSARQNVFDGDRLTFTTEPAAGHIIGDVTGCGGVLDGATYTTSAIAADCSVTATFDPVTHTVTPSADANGTIDPSVPQTVDDGSTASFIVESTPPYAIGDVSGCDGSLVGNTYTTGAVTADCTVTATFSIPDLIFGDGFDLR